EETNLSWARKMEKEGVHVIFGVPGLKTHCKLAMVVRKEADGIRRYCHLSTGNYNDRTSQLYGDLGMFTCREEITEEVAAVFDILTGYAEPRGLSHLLIAPYNMRPEFIRRIRREAENVQAGRRAGIIAKMNSLVDPEIIDELYLASMAGVPIQLIVRGICCLKPGVPGLSENITAISIIDRFLEHARIYIFENDGHPEYFLASADWMPRNLDRRIEVGFPVLAPALQQQIREIIDLQLADNVKARVLNPDCTNVRKKCSGTPVRSQEALYEMAKRYAR
ncbi:MAG: RNA degradosome polyphosphate kinase, partial [candidate division KSB1 bacterium]|nr:RNA degradosome polyphosphate kinase [candidate division KSB1 bacterium]